MADGSFCAAAGGPSVRWNWFTEQEIRRARRIESIVGYVDLTYRARQPNVYRVATRESASGPGGGENVKYEDKTLAVALRAASSCVCFLRTQQCAKSQCIRDVLPPSAGLLHGLVTDFLLAMY